MRLALEPWKEERSCICWAEGTVGEVDFLLTFQSIQQPFLRFCQLWLKEM